MFRKSPNSLNQIYIYIIIFGVLACGNFRSDMNDEDYIQEENNIIIRNNDSGNKLEKIDKSGEYLNIKDTELGNNAELYNKHNSIEAKFSDKYPKYRIMFPKTCSLEGECPNPKCEAYNDYAWSPMSNYKKINKIPNNKTDIHYNYIHLNCKAVFNLGEEIRNAKCPLCDYYYLKVKALGISKAEVEIETLDEKGNKKIKVINTSEEGKHFVYQKLIPENINEYTKTKIKINIKQKN